MNVLECTTVSIITSNYGIGVMRDYECQPFGEKGVLATLEEAFEFLDGIKNPQVAQLGIALCKAWRRHSKGVKVVSKEDEGKLYMKWVYGIFIPLDKARAFALLAGY